MLAALGSVAVSGATAVSTGAFTSVSASRDVSIAVAGDADAFLALTPSNGPNGAYASLDDGELVVRLDGSDDTPTGAGVNNDAVTRLTDVFRIENRGTQEVFVHIEPFGGDTVRFLGGTTTAKNGAGRIFDAPPSGLVPGQTPPMEGSENALRTPVGAPIPVSLVVDTTGSNTLDDLAEGFIIRAQADPPADSPFDGSRFDSDS
jgi:hypothetical protein